MWVFNEGVPRAGKSYDCVKHHILPALKRGRPVFARLNGLKHDAIADYLKLPRERVRELLHQVETKDVYSTFQCYRDEESGQWRIPEQFKDALVVIDEVHEFYVQERKPLPPEVENFFALLGQNGGDGVILTQWLNRVHSAIKARLEKKNSFQKLSAVGMEGKYVVTYYQTVAAGKFEKIGSATKSYDKDIFPLYDGYAPGADNIEVYKEGGTNVWAAMAVKAVLFGGAGLAGFVALAMFFTGKMSLIDKPEKPAKAAVAVAEPVEVYDVQGNYVGTEGGTAGQGAAGKVKEVVDPYKDLLPGQRYVAELADKGRVRLAARATINDRELAVVEWVDSSGNTIESLDLTQLRELGFAVTGKAFGFELVAGNHTIIATPWPRVVQVRDSDATLYNTSKAGLMPGTAALATVGSEGGRFGAGSGPISGSVVPGSLSEAGNPANVVSAPDAHF
ncbi:zonular occludens toxin domain-containing protein [Pseudoxanthomonas beigongshangi]